MNTYKVKEIFYTLQGEGAQSGRPAVFCRFSGCNLWSGREVDRPKAICQFCDTDFWGTDGQNGGTYTKQELAEKIKGLWPEDNEEPVFVVCTGGEPLLQLDQPLIDVFHSHKFIIAVETNGTIEPPKSIDWVCVSPKAGAELKIKQGHELKLVFPQPGAMPEIFEHLDFKHFYLQPMDGKHIRQNTQLTLKYCLNHPKWKMSLQTHKILGIE